MNIEEKCERLAEVLETFAVKLKDPDLGAFMWQRSPQEFVSLIQNLQTIMRTNSSMSYADDEWDDIIID